MENWREFEEEVRYVYDVLLKLKGETLLVTQNARVRGRSQAFHQIDVYYEFERAGTRHKVAIECADTRRPVDKARVGDFALRLNDIGNTIGLVVSRGGYQPGADALAAQYGIDLLRPEDLPSMGAVLSKRLATATLPDEASVGQPFWAIMALRDGKATGGYYATEQPGTNRRHIPLLYSKSHAERIMREARLDPLHWGVRGLARFPLRAFIQTLDAVETQGGGAVILLLPPAAREDADFIAMPISRQQLIDQYYGAPVPRVQAPKA